MARNEEGEFELVLGNKQLLSVFFILVVLLGVFFTMGYIVGRNNPSLEAASLAVARKPAGAPSGPPREVDAGSPTPATPRVVDAPKAEPPAAEAPKPEPPKTEVAKAEPVKPDPPKKETDKKEPEKKEPEKKAPEQPKPAPVEPPVTAAVTKPTPGSYLQVAAIDVKGANVMVDSLRKRNFPAIITPGPADRPNIVRVLIGPMSSPEEVARVRTRLEAIGMKGAVPKRL
ncbi:MAG: SPOR domain-containing protein [Acidobacteriaceae bacterium]|nr:SPOR domain-containing protein [Acidobacteriaceae bacterium]